MCLLVGSFVIGSEIARHESLREARQRTKAMADLVVAPLVGRHLREHRPEASRQIDTVMANRLRDGSLAHVKVWSADGQVIWSDEKELMGRRFELPAEVREIFGTGRVVAEVSELGRAENARERGEGSLIEVYVAGHDADGRALVTEAYLPTDRLHRDQRAITYALLGLSVGALVIFQLAMIPLAMSLARRVERGRQDAIKLTRHALLASDLERRRIAQDLHDGVIPDLACIGYMVPGLRGRLSSGGADADALDNLTSIGDIVTRDVAALRTLLTDIYPPDLEGEGLLAAIEDLAEESAVGGVHVEVSAPTGMGLPIETAQLAYRVVREGLRNVVKHARATQATARLYRDGDEVVATVTDNGVGVRREERGRDGHLGLRLLEDTMADLGGRLELSSDGFDGTRLEATFPVELAIR